MEDTFQKPSRQSIRTEIDRKYQSAEHIVEALWEPIPTTLLLSLSGYAIKVVYNSSLLPHQKSPEVIEYKQYEKSIDKLNELKKLIRTPEVKKLPDDRINNLESYVDTEIRNLESSQNELKQQPTYQQYETMDKDMNRMLNMFIMSSGFVTTAAMLYAILYKRFIKNKKKKELKEAFAAHNY